MIQNFDTIVPVRGHGNKHPELLYTCRDVRFDNTIALIRLTNCLPLTMTVIIDKIDNPSGLKILHAFHFPGKNVVKVKVKTWLYENYF